MMIWANKITGANAGGRRQLPLRTRRAARVAQFWRWPELDVDLDLDRIAHPEKYPLIAK